jgi:sn-glycerol 3-phosphate transport system substrate-binding protein
MRKLCVILCCLAAAFCVISCGAKKDSPAQKKNIVFWHSMGGNLGETISTLVEQFNASQNSITIEAQYQGSYDESITKLRAAMRTKAGPDLIQVFEAGTRFMVDSGFIIPIQKLISEYNLDVSKLEPNVLAYYTINNQLNSMPFNTSTALLYYNKDILAELGYPNGPADWKEINEIALKAVAMNDPNIRYGLVGTVDTWIFEQLLIQTRAPTIDNENGRSAPATKCVLDKSDRPLDIVRTWKALRDSGAWADLGTNGSDIEAAFISGMAVMRFTSTAGMRSMLSSIGGKFELGACFVPPLDRNEPNGGVTLGGASLYMLDNGKDKDTEGAIAEFIKFMITPETQAYWHINTGYYPITTEAYTVNALKENMVKYPQFQTAIDQLRASKNAGFGAIYGSFVEGRQVLQRYIEQTMMDDITPEECIQNCVTDIDVLIANYNAANR